MQLLQLYATGATTADSVAQLIVPKSGKLVALNFAGNVEDAAGDGEVVWEVSLSSTQQMGTNDAQNVIATIDGRVNATDTIACINHQLVFPGGISLQAGTRIYLHRVARTAATTATANINLLMQ